MSYALIGDPIKNQLTAQLLEAAFRKEGMSDSIQVIEVDPIDPEALANFCYESDLNEIKGIFVETPYQEHVMDYLDYLDPLAKKIGFANVLKNENSNLNGYNSVITGIIQTLQANIALPNKEVLILGDGLIAQAAIYGLKEFGAKISIWSQDREKIKALAKGHNVEPIDFRQIKEIGFDLVVQASKIGQNPQIEQSLLRADQIKKGSAVMETILNPMETQLLREAKKAGAKSLQANHLLLHQAAGAFEIWLEKPAPFEAMKSMMDEYIKTNE